jgi:hypothetical protein
MNRVAQRAWRIFWYDVFKFLVLIFTIYCGFSFIRWVLAIIHDNFHISWMAAICYFSFTVALIFPILSIGSVAISIWYRNIWRTAEKEIQLEDSLKNRS